MQRINLLLMFLFFLGTTGLNAQRPDTFSVVRSEFINQLRDFMSSNKIKKVEEVFSDFEANFSGGLFKEDEIAKIHEIGSKMLTLRMSANPYFTNYLECLNIVKRNYPDPERLEEWHLVIDRLLDRAENERANLPFSQFLNFTKVFYDIKALKYSKGGTAWYAIGDDFKLDMIEGDPVVRFEDLDLMCSYKNDSILIQGTSGVFYTIAKKWVGERGKVDWKRHKDLEDEIYAELPDYSFDMTKGTFEVENARMYFPLFFGQRLVKGKFTDKVVALSDGAVPSYPQFESYDKSLKLDNIGEGVAYKGGIRIKGTTIYGYGSKENKAQISIFDERESMLFAGNSELFVIRQGKQVYGQRVAATLFFEMDSIYHPSVNIQFNIPDKIMKLTRGKTGVGRNPFFSSYHQVEINADGLEALFKQDSLVIGKRETSISNKSPVTFESREFFKESDYNRFQNISSVNPIAAMKVTAVETGLNYLQASTIATKLNPKYEVQNIKNLLYDMVSRGFIKYNDVTEEVEITDKVFHYADAKQKKIDFDVLRIISDTLDVNANLVYQDNAISIGGVKRLEFSEKQMVGLLPKERKVTLKKNRDMEFGGTLYAGLSKMEGDDFRFYYDKFKIEFDSSKYFDFFVPTGEFDKKTGRPKAFGINSRVENISGVLLIDAPNNKSGREDITMFPSLQTNNFSYVYYDRREIQDSVYVRDSFYFRLDPFNIDHLDYFPRKDIAFNGKLFSYQIFPVFADTLKLQDDGSLGLITDTPEEGYDAYTGKGLYNGEIRLNNSGLQGDGNLQYLGASVDATNIVYRPKQMTAKADTFFLAEDRESDVQVPQVRGVDVSLNWRPYKDSMYITTQEKPFDFFLEQNHTLQGLVTYTPGGIKGDGLFKWDRASMASRYFSFGAFSTEADSTDLRIFAYNESTNSEDNKPAIKTDDVFASVNFDDQKGYFKSYDKLVKTELPFNAYQTSMNEFDWDMKEEVVYFNSVEDQLGRFLSTDKKRDSLRFEGATAFYDLKSNLLKVGGVPYIVSADAFIYPDSGKVEVQAEGVMTTLENARIVADTITKYHVINRATVNIIGRRYYTGSGFYEYNVGDKEQEIKFADIKGQPFGNQRMKNNPAFTKAEGIVTELNDFFIDLKTQYKGRIRLSSDSKNLFFDGYARLNADKLPERYWLSIKSEGDKNNLIIKYNKPKGTAGENLFTGFYLDRLSANIYPRVMMPLVGRKDRGLLPVTGYFKYDKENDSFIFGDSTRIYTENLKGNKLVFDNKTRKVNAEGVIKIGTGFKMADIIAGGTMEMDFPKEMPNAIPEPTNPNIMIDPAAQDSAEVKEPYPDIKMKLMAAISMAIPDRLLKIMSLDIVSSAFATPNISYLTDLQFFKMAASQVLPENKENKEAINFISSGYLELPKKNNPYTFLFSDLEMTWNSEYQSFVNSADKLGMASISGETINKMLDGYIQLNLRRNGDDRLYIYIESPSGSYFYFGLKQGILDIVSDNQAFNNELLKMKKKDLVIKLDNGETLEIQLVEPGPAKLFVKRMKVLRKSKK